MIDTTPPFRACLRPPDPITPILSAGLLAASAAEDAQIRAHLASDPPALTTKTVRIEDTTIPYLTLTPHGLVKLLVSLDDSDPLHQVDPRDLPIKWTTAKNTTHRMLRVAEAVGFCARLGVHTPHTAVAQLGVDPYICGYPHCTRTATHLHTLVTGILVDHLTQLRQQGKALPSIADTDTICMYTIADLPTAPPVIRTVGDLAKQYNDTVGVLVDFGRRCSYMIYRPPYGRKTLRWHTDAYSSYCMSLSQSLDRLELDYYGYVQTAIILCSDRDDMLSKMADAHKMAAPYASVIPVVMDDDGLDQLRTILEVGTYPWYTATINSVYGTVTGLVHDPDYQSPEMAIYNGQWAFVGTAINYQRVARTYQAAVKQRRLPYIICRDDQAVAYRTLLDRMLKGIKADLNHPSQDLATRESILDQLYSVDMDARIVIV